MRLKKPKTIRQQLGTNPPVPCFSHPGSKADIAPDLIPFFPKEIDTFVSGCTGTGALVLCVMRAVEAGLLSVNRFVLNDIDPQTVEFLRQVERIGDTVTVPERTEGNYKVYKEMAQENGPEAIIMEPHLTYGGSGYERGCYGGDKGHPKSQAGYERDLREACRLLRKSKPTIVCGSYEHLDLESLGPKDFYFHDGPYIDTDVRKYPAWGRLAYIFLVQRLKSLSCMWAMNEYPHEVYEPLGPPVWKKEVQNKLKRRRGSKATECLWIGNYSVLGNEAGGLNHEHTHELDTTGDTSHRECIFRSTEGTTERQASESPEPLQQGGDPAVTSQCEGH